MKIGDIVWIFYDTGAFGITPLFGIVIKKGPKTYTVRWESNIKNRIRHGEYNIKHVTDPELLKEAKKALNVD